MRSELDFIWQRRSVRSFTDRELTGDEFRELLEAAMAAPSACGCDPWEFVVVNDKNMRQKMAAVLPNGQFLNHCGGAIIICGNSAKAHTGSLSYMLQDCAAAMENILLAAPALGLGACWLGVHPREERITQLRQLFSIPENITPFGACAIGEPVVPAVPRTRYDAARVHGESWDEEVVL